MGYLVVLAIVTVVVVAVVIERKKVAAMTPSERLNYHETLLHGPSNPVLICPHCQEKGRVRTKPVTRKKGISGGKATAAIFTAGVSMLATGLSRKENLTQAHCGNCGSTWEF
jgi:hypothetical protein